jgi:hypothetical protein
VIMKINFFAKRNNKKSDSGNISPASAVFRHIQSRPFQDDEATEAEKMVMTKTLEQIKKIKR